MFHTTPKTCQFLRNVKLLNEYSKIIISYRLLVSATEIRCKEESKGGLKFDVIIADPAASPPKRPSSPKDKDLTAEEIAEKLKAAEERRMVRRQLSVNTIQLAETNAERSISIVIEFTLKFTFRGLQLRPMVKKPITLTLEF